MVVPYNIKKINKFTYSLKINGECASKLCQILQQMLILSHYDDNANTIHFSAEKVTTLKKLLENGMLKMTSSIKMIYDLTKQMQLLNILNYGFYGFDITDIVCVDGLFLLCNAQYINSLISDTLIFIEPINVPYFSSPEIITLTNLPAKINKKCCYYSLGLLVAFCILNINLLVDKEFKSYEEVEQMLIPITNTKIYWFIKRCLEEDIDKRMLLLI